MSEEPLIAVFVDYENLALGARDSKWRHLNIDLILRRLLEKGRIVYKRAYCDWSQYRSDVRDFHARGIELIDIPRSKMSGKNSADIRMVVDALDLCYTKSHVDTFVIISGDSDFSPLVSKLRENNKVVIGVGVKNSTSDLLIANCDEFIFYDDLIRTAERRKPRKKKTNERKESEGRKESDDRTQKVRQEARAEKAFDQVLETIDDLISERGDEDKLWGSMVKQALKRRKPGFNESYHGFRSFGKLLEEMEERSLLTLEHDQKSGGYIITSVN